MKTFCIRKYRREKMKEYRSKNHQKILDYERSYRDKHRNRINELNRANRAKNRDAVNAYQREYFRANPERYKVYNERYRGNHPKRTKMTPEQRKQVSRERWYRKAYGISATTFDEMLAKQENKCAICKRESDKWVVDHCHNNGHIRGILCNNCNLAIGLLKHSAISAESARDYLL